MRHALYSSLIASLALLNAGCGLISADFDGTVKITALVSGDDGETVFESIETVDPNSNQDYRDNKDRIKEGEVYAIDLKVVQIAERNNANIVSGQVDVRPEGAAAWVTAVAEWDGVQVARDNTFRLNLTPETQAELNRIVFENDSPIQLNLHGVADTDPVDFQVEITLHMRFTAGL